MNTKSKIKELPMQNALFDEEQGFANVVEKEDNSEIVEIDNPYDPKLINIVPQFTALYNIIQRLRENEIDLSPDFQRSPDLWNDQKQSLLIESILIRIPLPAFYFDGSNDNKWLVIDGLQRLCAIKNFVVSKTLKLTGLEYLSQFSGFYFDELPRPFQRQIAESQITAYIMTSGTPDVKYNIFKRINTGGVTLNPQEIRNALNQGVPSEFVTELADSEAFKLATNNKISSKRMLDREFITRFITFYLYAPTEYTSDLDTFMSKAMGELDKLSISQRNEIKQNFVAAMYLANEIFGNWAFRKVYNNTDGLYPINKALFEIWSVLLAKLSNEEREKIKTVKANVFNDYIQLINNDDSFVGAITSQTDRKSKIIYRFSKIEQLLKNRLYDK
jgi:hypothetical protein